VPLVDIAALGVRSGSLSFRKHGYSSEPNKLWMIIRAGKWAAIRKSYYFGDWLGHSSLESCSNPDVRKGRHVRVIALKTQ